MSDNLEKIFEDEKQNLKVFRKTKNEYVVMMGERQELLTFHIGPLRNGSVQGLTNEALLAILINRTREVDNYQPAKENKLAIQHMVAAVGCFKDRTARLFKELMQAGNQ